MTYPSDPRTLLVISTCGVALYSATGLRDTLEPEEASDNQRRNINGDLIDISPHQMRKLKGTITGNDQDPPIWIWPGTVADLEPVTPIAFLTANSTPATGRTVIESWTRGPVTFNRIQLSVMFGQLKIDTDEWGGRTGWTLPWREN